MRLGSRAEVQLPPRQTLLRSDGEIVMVLDDCRWLGDCISSRVTDIQLVITPQTSSNHYWYHTLEFVGERLIGSSSSLTAYSCAVLKSPDAPLSLPQLLRHRGRRLVLLLRRNHRVVRYGVPYRYVLIDAMCAKLIPDIYGMKVYRRWSYSGVSVN